MLRVHLVVYDDASASSQRDSSRGAAGGHQAVAVGQVEWSFKQCQDGTGVFCCHIGQNRRYRYLETLDCGDSSCSSKQEFEAVLNAMKPQWPGSSYDPATRNSTTFCQELCRQLGVQAPNPGLRRTSSGVHRRNVSMDGEIESPAGPSTLFTPAAQHKAGASIIDHLPTKSPFRASVSNAIIPVEKFAPMIEKSRQAQQQLIEQQSVKRASAERAVRAYQNGGVGSITGHDAPQDSEPSMRQFLPFKRVPSNSSPRGAVAEGTLHSEGQPPARPKSALKKIFGSFKQLVTDNSSYSTNSSAHGGYPATDPGPSTSAGRSSSSHVASSSRGFVGRATTVQHNPVKFA